ncbi:hypothetical protein AB0F17_54215 [Nonomuraea sp. NPDC026600]
MLACDALRFDELSLDVSNDAERASPAQIAGEALAKGAEYSAV